MPRARSSSRTSPANFLSLCVVDRSGDPPGVARQALDRLTGPAGLLNEGWISAVPTSRRRVPKALLLLLVPNDGGQIGGRVFLVECPQQSRIGTKLKEPTRARKSPT